MRYALFIVLFGGIAGLAHADNCRQVQAAVSSVAVTSFVPAAVIVPYYSAVYSPPATNATSDEILLQLLQEIRGLRADLKALADPNQPQGKQGATAPPPNNLDALSFKAIQKNCSACHTEPAKDGAGLVLVAANGAEALISDDNKIRVHNRIIRDSMPPRDSKFFPLPVEDKKLILSKFK